MRSFLFLILLLSLGFRSKAQDSVYMFSYFINNGEDGLHLAYSNDGLKWEELHKGKSYLTPELSVDKLMRDPCIIRGADNNFHMVWTVSWTQRSIGYAHSKDLINWSEQQIIPVMEHEPLARNTWAPEITYDPINNDYILYWSTTITGLYPESQAKEEKGYNHRIYYSKTKDFKNFEETKLLFEPGFNVIDATILSINGLWRMFIKDETIVPPQKNIRMVSATNIEGPYSNISPPLTGQYWAEGPTVTSINGEWIIYFDKYTEHKYGAIKSKDLQNWVDISDKIDMPQKMRHGTVFKISKQEFENLK